MVVGSHRDGPYSGADGEHYLHARLTGLKPSTTYRFMITSDGESSPQMHFTTAPADDREFHLLFGGDSLKVGWIPRWVISVPGVGIK